MGFRPLLGLFIRQVTTPVAAPRLLRVTACGAEEFGPPLPISGEFNQPGTSMRTFVPNRAIVFQGDPWIHHSGVIWRLDTSSSNRANWNWVREYQFSEANGGLQQRYGVFAGLHKILISGIPHLVTAYPTQTSPNWRGVKYNAVTRQWTESIAYNRTVATTSQNLGVASAIFRDKVYWVYGLGSASTIAVQQYDPVNNTITNISTGSLAKASYTSNFCSYKGRLLQVCYLTGTQFSIYEIAPNNMVQRIANIGTSLGVTPNATGQDALAACWADGDYMYVIIHTSAGPAFGRVSVDDVGNWTITNITSTVCPYVLQNRAFMTATPHWYVISDVHDDLSPPTIYLAVSDAANNIWIDTLLDVWKWNGPSTRMTLVSNCALNSNYLCWGDNTGGGHRSFTPGRPDVDIVSVEDAGSAGDVRVYYRVLESWLYPSGTPCNVKFLVSPNKHQIPDTVAILRPTTASPDGTVNNNIIGGLTTGSGVLRSVIWRAGIQGATSTQWQIGLGVVEIE
jgi:hypothetical protein